MPFSLEQMSLYKLDHEAPDQFKLAAMGLTDSMLRPELETLQIPAPKDIAPIALAFSAQVPNPADTPMNRGVGRIVFLFDSKEFETWGSNMRVIAYGKSPLENDVGIQDDAANYWWHWLMRALEHRGAKFSHEAGTVTKMSSTGMGALATDREQTEIEIRASWSPQEDDLGPHLAAWQDLISGMAGFEIGGEGVARIARAQ
ncbi:MAG: DUF3000 family protein [Micrococcales bacterium]|nr:DUF3000 family protein [Micrococcales bacterium]